MGKVPVVEQKWDSKSCWNKKTVFAGQVSVAHSLKDDSQGRGSEKRSGIINQEKREERL